MKHIVNFVLAIVSLLLAAALVVSYFSSFVQPERLGSFALLWFAMPYLWAANALLFTVLLFLRRWFICLVPAAAMVATWGGMSTIVSFGPAQQMQGTEVRVATFNIRYMELADTQQYIDFFHNQNADIICLQEMATSWQLRNHGIDDVRQLFPDYPYIIDRTQGKLAASGEPFLNQMIVSRLPIKEIVPCDGQEMPFVLAARANLPDGKTIDVFNVHLQSIHLMPKHLNAVNKVPHEPLTEETQTSLRQTARLIINAFDKRTEQTHLLAECLAEREQPTIVCGDFNDTPVSYTYHTLTQYLTDSFCSAKGGFGRTYNGKLPPLRIDYILSSQHFCGVRYREHRIDLSDHLPVSATLVLK